MTNRDHDKGLRYIAALDTARCQDKWDDVPELIRKVTKHAPHKTCTIEIASAEHQVITHIRNRNQAAKSGNDAAAPSSELSELVPSIMSTVEKSDRSAQDYLQAQVCLGWVHWLLNEPELATTRLPYDFAVTIENVLNSIEPLSPWTEVCLVKGSYIKGAAQSIIASAPEALETLKSVEPWLNRPERASSTAQFLHWSEKFLSKGATLAAYEVCKNVPVVNDDYTETALKLFRIWTAHPIVKQGFASNATQIEGPMEPASKATPWKAYYDLLGAILQYGLTYFAPRSGAERPQLASEFRLVELKCESSFLREEKFPMAYVGSPNVEAWVEQVIRNWEILCGPQWCDEDFGAGGQDGVSRNVLDILYRAASKTYHSHNILRRLFHVHSSLAEFDLALRALDTYIEIVTSAKERAEKSAEYGELEKDETFLRTLSEGIFALCCFGSPKQAEKAKDVAMLIKTYLNKHEEEGNQGDNGASPETNSSGPQAVSPAMFAMAYRAVGIGLANWASLTPINESRDDIRAEAIEYLERSISPEFGDEYNYSSLYTLALLLAENRDLDGAIDYVKSALTWNNQPTSPQVHLSRQRDLVSLWHLLALLLSAKYEFGIGERSCEAAFEQFPSALASFGANGKSQMEQVQNDSEQINSFNLKHNLIDQLRGREKERIIETRMTQLAFVEVSEGPEAALNHSDQLLGLFGTLFPDLDGDSKQVKANKESRDSHALAPPRSPTGTAKSVRGNVFGRRNSKGTRPPIRASSMTDVHEKPNLPLNEMNANASPVTNGDTNPSGEPGRPRSNSTRSKLRKHSGSVKGTGTGTQQSQDSPYVNGDGANGVDAETSGSQQQTGATSKPGQTAGTAVSDAISRPPSQPQSAKQPLRPIAHNMKHEMPAPIGHAKQPPEQDVRLPFSYRFDSPTAAVTRFPSTQAKKHALGILVKIWLLVAGLYRRASLFEDAQESCEEASKQAARVEALVASHERSARSFSDRGWGAGKSSEELWADVHAERGFLAQTQSRPHEAIEHFEEALVRQMDHPKATVGLASLLLDIWDQKLPLDPPQPTLDVNISSLALSESPKPHNHNRASSKSHRTSLTNSLNSDSSGKRHAARQSQHTKEELREEDEARFLHRLAARERAYGLLSALTKLGSSWDNSEAWYALSRAYEAGGQVEKLKEVLWWCIELEDTRPVRHWSNIGSGLYVL